MKIAACDRNGITTDTNDRRITWQALIYDYRCFQCGKVPVQRYDFETETYYAECQGCGEGPLHPHRRNPPRIDPDG